MPTDATPGFDGGKTKGTAALSALGDELSDLQERLWAEKTTGSPRRVLLVLQGMDTSGKGGVLRHTVGLVDPQGVKITSFKAPTDEERRAPLPVADPQRAAPPRLPRGLRPVPLRGRADRPGARPGDPRTVESRYDQINEFEAELAAAGVVIVKCMLHLSADEQRARLLARLDNEDKYWKFNPGDVDERERWSDYRSAYEAALERTNTEIAPWYVVPSDKKWYRNLVVGRLLLEHLRGMALSWPPPDFDVREQRRRLLDEGSV